MPIKEQAIALDEQNPWPGLAPYDETGQRYFKGREEDTEELLRLVRLAPLTALYGKSGLGKSSLLRAGLFPKLRQSFYLPVYIRLDCSREKKQSPMLQVFELLLAEMKAQQVDYTEPNAGESLWQYLHRRDLELWSSDNHLLTPVLVFDQFEEIFSHGRKDPEELRHTCHELADLIENRIPSEIGFSGESRQTAAQLDLLSQRYRIILSFREDFLPEIKNWERDVPSLLRQWRQIKPMTREQAIEAVSESGASVLSLGAAQAIVDFVGNLDEARTEGVNTIEPVLLSLCCYQLNIRRQQRRAALIDSELLKHVGQNILQEFYSSAIARMPGAVARFIETQLILGDRYRASYPVKLAVEKGFINEAQLAELTGKHRLLRIDQQLGSDRIELIHDRLVGVVKRARDQRKVRTDARRVWFFAVLTVFLTMIGMGGLAYWQRGIAEMNRQWAVILEEKADPKTLAMAQTALADARRKPSPVDGNAQKELGVVYIQIRDDSQLSKYQEIQAALIRQGFRVPDIETLSTGPSRTEVRYFIKNTAAQADRIAQFLTNAGVKDVAAKFMPDNDQVKHTRNRKFEIWFSRDAFQN